MASYKIILVPGLHNLPIDSEIANKIEEVVKQGDVSIFCEFSDTRLNRRAIIEDRVSEKEFLKGSKGYINKNYAPFILEEVAFLKKMKDFGAKIVFSESFEDQEKYSIAESLLKSAHSILRAQDKFTDLIVQVVLELIDRDYLRRRDNILLKKVLDDGASTKIIMRGSVHIGILQEILPLGLASSGVEAEIQLINQKMEQEFYNLTWSSLDKNVGGLPVFKELVEFVSPNIDRVYDYVKSKNNGKTHKMRTDRQIPEFVQYNMEEIAEKVAKTGYEVYKLLNEEPRTEKGKLLNLDLTRAYLLGEALHLRGDKVEDIDRYTSFEKGIMSISRGTVDDQIAGLGGFLKFIGERGPSLELITEYKKTLIESDGLKSNLRQDDKSNIHSRDNITGQKMKA